MAQPAIKYRGAIETGAQAEGDGFYNPVQGTPWENLGNVIPKGATTQETLVAAGLNWRVLRGRSIARVELEDGREIEVDNPDAFTLVRDTDLQILSPFVGKRYKLIQNDAAFEVFAEFVQAGQMQLETAGSFSNGKHVWGLARTGHGFELADGERIESYFLLLQSHLYGNGLKAMWTPVRYPGGHTLVHNINKKGIGVSTTYSMSHARVFDDKRIQEIKEVVGIAARAMEDFQGKVEFMARMRIDPESAIGYLISLFDKDLPGRCEVRGEDTPKTFAEIQASTAPNRNLKRVAKMLDMKYRDGQGTAWGCWNAVNGAYDHELGHGQDTRLESIWLGKGKDSKVKGFNLAYALAARAGK